MSSAQWYATGPVKVQPNRQHAEPPARCHWSLPASRWVHSPDTTKHCPGSTIWDLYPLSVSSEDLSWKYTQHQKHWCFRKAVGCQSIRKKSVFALNSILNTYYICSLCRFSYWLQPSCCLSLSSLPSHMCTHNLWPLPRDHRWTDVIPIVDHYTKMPFSWNCVLHWFSSMSDTRFYPQCHCWFDTVPPVEPKVVPWYEADDCWSIIWWLHQTAWKITSVVFNCAWIRQVFLLKWPVSTHTGTGASVCFLALLSLLLVFGSHIFQIKLHTATLRLIRTPGHKIVLAGLYCTPLPATRRTENNVFSFSRSWKHVYDVLHNSRDAVIGLSCRYSGAQNSEKLLKTWILTSKWQIIL